MATDSPSCSLAGSSELVSNTNLFEKSGTTWPTTSLGECNPESQRKDMMNKGVSADKPFPMSASSQSNTEPSGLHAVSSHENIAKIDTLDVHQHCHASFNEVRRKLVHDRDFIQDIVKPLKQEDQTMSHIPTIPIIRQYVNMNVDLTQICRSNNLPPPIVETTIATDKRGVKLFQSSIKIGYNGEHTYISKKCDSMDDAVTQAKERALQALEDLDLVTNHPNGSARQNSELQGQRPPANYNRPDQRPLLCISTEGSTPPGTHHAGRKRCMSDSQSIQCSISTILGLLREIPASDGETRMKVMCGYLNIDEPFYFESPSQEHPSSVVARFSHPALIRLQERGSTRSTACLKLVSSVIDHLRDVGIQNFTTQKTHRKREYLDDITTTKTRAAFDVSNEIKEEVLFFIDPNGDDRVCPYTLIESYQGSMFLGQ